MLGELLRDPDDPRRRGVRWEEVNLEDGSMDVYRKEQQWDAASLPDPVLSPLRSYQKLIDPPTDRWPVFPTFDQQTLATLVREELADQGLRPEAIAEHREASARDLLLALKEDIPPNSLMTDGARSILRRLTAAANIDIDHPKHDYLAPHGGRRGMGEALVRAFGYTVAARISTTQKKWFESGTRISRQVNSVTSQRRRSLKPMTTLHRFQVEKTDSMYPSSSLSYRNRTEHQIRNLHFVDYLHYMESVRSSVGSLDVMWTILVTPLIRRVLPWSF